MSLLLEPSKEQIKEEKLYQQMGVSDDEFALIESIIGRLPNYTEIGIFPSCGQSTAAIKTQNRFYVNSRLAANACCRVPEKARESLTSVTIRRSCSKLNLITIRQRLSHTKVLRREWAASSVTFSQWAPVR